MSDEKKDVGTKVKDAAIDSALSFAKAASAAVAMELPPPFGAAASRALGFLFGMAAGGDKTVEVIQGMLDRAVDDLKTFMTRLQIEEVSGDVETFLTWVKLNIGPTGGNLEDTLKLLEDGTKGFKRGTLFSNLVHIASNDRYIQSGKWIERQDDYALAFIVTCLGAQFIAQRLTYLLASHIAADVFHEGLYTVENDKRYQASLKEANDAVSDMFVFLRRSFPPPAPTLAEFAAAMTRAVDTQQWQPGRWDRLPFVDELYNRAAAPFTNMNTFATTSGWAPAIERLILLRQLNRLRAITLVAVEGENSSRGELGQNVPEYRFWDNVTGFYWSDRNYGTTVQQWKTYLQQRVDELGSAYAADLAVLKSLQDRLNEMSSLLPPNTPMQQVPDDLIDSWSREPPPPGSLWSIAVRVRYAFSYESAHGPGIRGPWSSGAEVNGRWKPTLRQLPMTNEDPTLQRLVVWRQFLLPKDRSSADDFDLPVVVGKVAPIWFRGTPRWRDRRPFLSPIRIRHYVTDQNGVAALCRRGPRFRCTSCENPGYPTSTKRSPAATKAQRKADRSDEPNAARSARFGTGTLGRSETWLRRSGATRRD